MRLFGTKKTQTRTDGDGWNAAYLARAERDNALDDLDQAVRERKLAIRERDAARRQCDDLIAKLNLPKVLHCSFCGKSQHDVRKMIAGPAVFICDECVELCMDIIREKEGAA